MRLTGEGIEDMFVNKERRVIRKYYNTAKYRVLHVFSMRV